MTGWLPGWKRGRRDQESWIASEIHNVWYFVNSLQQAGKLKPTQPNRTHTHCSQPLLPTSRIFVV